MRECSAAKLEVLRMRFAVPNAAAASGDGIALQMPRCAISIRSGPHPGISSALTRTLDRSISWTELIRSFGCPEPMSVWQAGKKQKACYSRVLRSSESAPLHGQILILLSSIVPDGPGSDGLRQNGSQVHGNGQCRSACILQQWHQTFQQ